MQEFIAKYWIEFGFTVITGTLIFIIKQLYSKIKENDKKQIAIELGIQALLRDRTVQAYYHYIDRKSITLHGLEAVEKMYKEYHNLGGNGTITKLVEDLKKMEVKE